MSTDRGWDVAVLVVFVALLGGLGAGSLRPRPTLVGAEDLRERGQYEVLEGRARSYLEAHPGDERARLLLAEAAVRGADPRPDEALERLEGLAPRERAQAALAKSLEGEAEFLENRYERAEKAWKEAIALDPLLPELGWRLLNLYALQGRREESRALGLQLFRLEPDPHDRVQLLLQLIRHDAHGISPDTRVRQLEPIAKANPSDTHSALAYGLALVHDSRFDEGLEVLEGVLRRQPERPEAWEAYLNGLVDAGRIELLLKQLDRLPPAMKGDQRFATARGWAASQRDDWTTAAAEFERAWRAHPGEPSTAYRLQQALRAAGRTEDLARLERDLAPATNARTRIRELWDELDARPDLGRTGYPAQFREVASILDSVGRREEAEAWRQLAREQPAPISASTAAVPTASGTTASEKRAAGIP